VDLFSVSLDPYLNISSNHRPDIEELTAVIPIQYGFLGAVLAGRLLVNPADAPDLVWSWN
jgi:hypothetical protein